ncbi:MAG: hypothetical protein J6A38_03175 [Clostridia bacterium]|nr:hypothetical protein [Clostridia bacterium]
MKTKKIFTNCLKKILVVLFIICLLISYSSCSKQPKFKDIKDDLNATIELEEDIGLLLYDNNFTKNTVSNKEANAMLSFLAEKLKTANLDYILDVLVDLVAKDFEISEELGETIIIALKGEKEIDKVAHFLKFLEKDDWLINYRNERIKSEITEHIQTRYSDLLANDFPAAIVFYTQSEDGFADVNYYKVHLPQLHYSTLVDYLDKNKEVIYTEQGLGGYYDGCKDKEPPKYSENVDGPFLPPSSATYYYGDFKLISRRTQYYNELYQVCYKTSIDIYFRDNLIMPCDSLQGEWYKVGDYLYNVDTTIKEEVLSLTIYGITSYLHAQAYLANN